MRRLGILAAALLASSPARAQDAGAQVVFAGSVGVTDNVRSAPESSTTPPEADGFGGVSPGFVLHYDTPRTSQRLAYTFNVSFYFSHPEATSYTNVAAWTGRFITTPTTDLTLSATGTQGQLNTFAATQEPGQTTVSAIPSGSTTFLQGGVNEAFNKQLSPVVSAGQAGSFLLYSPVGEDNPARTYNGTNTLYAQRLWRRDTGALALTFAYTHFDNVPVGELDSETLESRDQLLNTLVLSWQHDYGHYFSSQLDAGVTQSTDLSGGYAQLWQPVGLAAVRYIRDEGQAELSIAHAAQLNVFLSQIDLVDQATLRLALPLSRAARLGAEGSGGVQLSHPIDAGTLGASTTVLLGDAALVWSPVTFIPDFELALRYQHINQLATDAHLIRNTLTLSVGGAFPETTETATRILMTQPFGSSRPGDPARREQPAPEASDGGQEGEGGEATP